MILNFPNDKDNISITIMFYIVTNSGEILNQQAIIDAISEGILDESYSDVGLSNITIVTGPTPTCTYMPGEIVINKDNNYSNAPSIAIGTSVSTVGLIIALVLILLIFIIKL